MTATQAPQVRVGGLGLLIGSKFASTVAYATSWVLLPLYVYQASGSAFLTALASAANVLPFLLFGLVARFFRPLNRGAAVARARQPPGAITINPDAVFEMGMW